jgi:hypothetical protein
MTDQEIDAGIAKGLGWTKFMPQDDGWLWAVMPPPHPVDEDCGGVRIVPNYCGDHNALHEAVASLDDKQYQKYYAHLTRITTASAYHCGSIAWNRMIAEASSRHRAEALFLTLQKTTEQPK